MDIRAIRITPSNLDAAALAGVNRVVMGTGVYVSDTQGTDNSSANNSPATLKKPVADYPAVAEQNGDKATIVAALEYGAQIGVYEVGLYADDTHIATLQAELGGAGILPMLHLHKRCIYALSMTIETANEAAKLVKLAFEARADLTYAMLWHSHQSGFKLPIAETQTDNTVDDSANGAVGVDGNDGIIWDELLNCTYNNGELVWDGGGKPYGRNSYAAKTLNAPNSFSLQCNKVKSVSFFIGEEVDLTTLKTTGEGVYFSMYAVDDDYDFYRLTYHPQGHTGSTAYSVPLGFLPDDKLVWQISQSVLTITNPRTNEQIIIQNENIRPNSPLALIVTSGDIHVENFAIAPYTDPLPTDVVTVIYEQ